MEKNKLKQWLKPVVMLVFVLFMFIGISNLNLYATSGVEYDVADYKGDRQKIDWIAPTKKGQIFAGWYTDTTFQTPYKETTGRAVAKFVDASVLSVKKQINSTAKATSSKVDIRFLTSIDTLKFSSVGFEVQVNCNPIREFDLQETKAYTSVLVDGQSQPETAANVFGTKESVYFVLHSITGIPNAVFGDTFTVKPYWNTLDGTKVYGETDSFNINSLLSSPADVWYAPSTQKVRSDIAAEKYADAQLSGLNVKSGRFEYESAQIIMTAKEDIGSYDLIISDLTMNGNPNVKFSANNIEVYNQNYIYCEKSFEEGTLSTVGYYPDALVPFSSAKDYGENTANQGTNQGIWVTFYVPEGQKAGEYTGKFILEMDGYNHEVPVTLKVWDYEYARNYTAENCFLIDWTSFSYAELDSSQDIYDAYAEALLDYRLQPHLLMNDFAPSDPDDIEYYTKKAFELAQDERCTVVFLPFDYDHSSGDAYLVEKTMKDWIHSFVDISFNSYGTDKQLNLVAKTMSYITIIDEPTVNTGLIERTNYVTDQFIAYREQAKAECLATLGDKVSSGLSDEEYAFRLEVINSIDTIRNIVTAEKDDRLSDAIEVYCPQVQLYDTESLRAQYANDAERWWYTCVGPWYPYPTYHIDDAYGLLSSRAMSWMQADYGVIGNLYWATNIYEDYPNQKFLEDPYTETSERFLGANGDGFIFYPGNKYGVEGPVGTVRLHAIRDGLEEFEVLQGVEKVYQNIGVDFQSILSYLVQDVYSGTEVETTQAEFDTAREQICNVAELANMGGAISKFTKEKTGTLSLSYKVTVQLALPSNWSITSSHSASKTEQNGAYTYYTYERTFGRYSSDLQALKCTVSDGTKSMVLNLYLGGDTTQYLNSTLESVNAYNTQSVVYTTASAVENKNDASTANKKNLSSVASNTDILLYDFEDYARNFQLMRVMSYFGAVNVNEEVQYVKNGNGSAFLQPLGYHSTMMNNPGNKKSESCLYIPFTSYTYDFDYSNSAKINEISFSMYNAEEENVSVYVGLIYDEMANVVSTSQEFILEPGWNQVVYKLDHNMLAINYDLSNCYGMALSFDRAGSRELKDAPELYLDDIWLKLNDTAVTPENVIVLNDKEICDFEKEYQKYVVQTETFDKALRPDVSVVTASEHGIRATSGEKVLQAVLKPTDHVDGTIYDSIYLVESLIDHVDLRSMDVDEEFCFDIYNASNGTLDFFVAFHNKETGTYHGTNISAKPNQWTTFRMTKNALGEEYRNNAGEIHIHYSEFYGEEKTIYLDNFRIEKKQIIETPNYVDFTDELFSQSNFATTSGLNSCMYVDSATVNGTTIQNAIRFQASGQWPTISGFNPINPKEYYEQFRDGYLIIEMYVDSYSSEWGAGFYPKMYARYPGFEGAIADINYRGFYQVKLDAAIVLDNWDTFSQGSSLFYFDDGGGNITIDCYFTRMYFGFDEVPEVDDPTLVLNLNNRNWKSYFATVRGTELCSYVKSATVNGVEIKNAIRVQTQGEYPTISGFTPLNDKETYEQYREGKFVIEMYVDSAAGSTWAPEMIYVQTWPEDDTKVAMPQKGVFKFEVDAAKILDKWDTFISGGSYFYFGGGVVTADCYITGMYFVPEEMQEANPSPGPNTEGGWGTIH